jgi:predicted phosphodiesterase
MLGFRFQFSSDDVDTILSPLREYFHDFILFCLLIQPYEDSARSDEPTRVYSDESSVQAEDFFRAVSLANDKLFLLTEPRNAFEHVIDPSPALHQLATNPIQPPIALFWSSHGAACLLPIEEAKELYFRELSEVTDASLVNHKLHLRAKQGRSKRLLHLSDLHFGDLYSDSWRSYIKTHLRTLLQRIDRIIVTGDLINTPIQKYLDQYFEFRHDIRQMTGHDLIVIPGNHDVRPMGNSISHLLRPTYQLFAEIGWQQVIIDDQIKCLFFCFNSSEGGSLARGHVTAEQLRRVATTYQAICATRGVAGLDSYLKIALVHHHPYSYVTKATALYDRILRWITRDEDLFTRFENADLFLQWCATRGVSVILHGHKHVPHYIAAALRINNQDHRLLVIGCGSTTGAEKSELCYDVLSINPATNRCAVTFYHDPSGTGAGFRRQQITVDLRR